MVSLARCQQYLSYKAFVFKSNAGQYRAGSDKTIASLLSQTGENPSSTGEPLKASFKQVAIGTGLPSLSKRLVEKIASGHYVDFSELLPAKGRTRTMVSPEEGQKVLVRAKDLSSNRKLIPDLATWLQCFAVYKAVVIESQSVPKIC